MCSSIRYVVLIPLPCKTWYYKECNKNYKNLVLYVIRTLGTWNRTILQPPKYLVLIVNWFRYTYNNVTKDRCSIPMDMTIMLGPLKFSLRANIDHHGPSIHSGHYTACINCYKETFYSNDNKITKFEIIDSKNSSIAYVILYELIYHVTTEPPCKFKLVVLYMEIERGNTLCSVMTKCQMGLVVWSPCLVSFIN